MSISFLTIFPYSHPYGNYTRNKKWIEAWFHVFLQAVDISMETIKKKKKKIDNFFCANQVEYEYQDISESLVYAK